MYRLQLSRPMLPGERHTCYLGSPQAPVVITFWEGDHQQSELVSAAVKDLVVGLGFATVAVVIP